MIYHQLRDRQSAYGLRQHTESLHIGDVQHYQYVRLLECTRTHVARIAHIVAEQELVHVGPGCRIHDPRTNPHLAEQASERRLGTASVAVGVDVSRYDDRASRAELLRETLDRLPSLLGNAQKIKHCLPRGPASNGSDCMRNRSRDQSPSKRSTAPMSRAADCSSCSRK